MKKLIVLITVLIVSFLFAEPALALWPSANPANQSNQIVAKDAPDCFALDIVFVIDQSSSMGGDSQNNLPANDPLGLRYNAPRYALDWLANNRLSRLSQCPDVIHRIGVVSFGSDSIVSLPLTDIAPNTQDDWTKSLPALESQITGTNMKKTDTTKGIDDAIAMLANAKTLGDLPRKRAIILLTDGQPCIEALGGYCSDSKTTGSETISDYMNKLASDVNSKLPFSDKVKSRDAAIDAANKQFGGMDQIPDDNRNQIIQDNPVSNQDFYNSTYFWIIATNDATKYSDSVGQTFKNITGTRNGDLIDISTIVDIPKFFNQILSKLAGITPTLLSCGNLAVNPYLSGVVLDIYKVANGLEVQIIYNGKQLKNGEGDKDFFGLVQYKPYGAIEHYRFQNPPAGLWKIVCSDPNGAQVSFLPFNAHPQLQAPKDILPQFDVNGANSDPLHPYYLSYKIVNQTDGSPLNLDQNYPLDLKASITDPSGGKYDLPLKFQSDGTWLAQEPLHVNLKGVYHINLSGQAACVEDPDHPKHCPSPTIDVVKSSTDQYETTDVNLFKLNIIEPKAGKAVPLHGNLIPACLPIESLPVKVQLTDFNGNPLERDKVLDPAADQQLSATLTVGTNSKSIILTPDPTDKTAFIGTFTDPSRLGSHTLQVEIGEIYQYKLYRPAEKTVSENFIRDDPLFQKPVFYRILLAFLMLILAGIATYFARLFTFPLRGNLVFNQFDNETQQMSQPMIGLNKGRRWYSWLKKEQIPAQLKNGINNNQVAAQVNPATKPVQNTIKSLFAENLPARNGKAVVGIKINGIKVITLADGAKNNFAGWEVQYVYGSVAVQRDPFLLYLAAIVLVTLAIIALAFILPGCGYVLGLG